MNIDKQIFYNTEEIKELYEKKHKVSVCYEADRQYGGLHFILRRKAEVELQVEFQSVEGEGTIYLDGLVVSYGVKPYLRVVLPLEKGEHFVEADYPLTHGAFRITAEGVGLREGPSYLDRVGGTIDTDGGALYMKSRGHTVTKYVCDSGTMTPEETNYLLYDEAFLYDKTYHNYTGVRRYVYSVEPGKVVMYNGRSTTFTASAVTSAALCDCHTIGNAVDYLFAYTDGAGNLNILRTIEVYRFNSGNYTDPIPGIRRVVSAQRGSVLMVEDESGFWSGYFFHPNGANPIVYPQYTYYYDIIPIGRSPICAPSATVSEPDGTPIFYYRREDGRLMCIPYGGTPTVVAYADAFHPLLQGGILQTAGGLKYTTQ